MQKVRRAEREMGPLRFEADADVATIFPRLVQWKMEQYARTHVTNVLAFGWTKALLERVLAAEGEAFSGRLSALYMGDTLAAALLSMRSHGVVHAWFSAYDPELARLSPGIVFWLEMARVYSEQGIGRVDLGKGPERYKQEIMSGAIDLAEGSVDFRPVTAAFRRGWRKAYLWARSSPLRRPLLGPGRFLRSILESRSFRG
jgi:CelD/BcsL family acetyltransferase involved in cellulose biosynthesis